MGTQLLALYHERVKKEWKIAFLSTFIIGLLVHIYKFTNNLPNHDSLFNYYSSQNMVGLGRWFLSIACSFSSYFDLPWVIGLFSVVLIALTAVVIAELFEMKNPVLIVICGGLLVSFPAITETFFFEFTADGYMLAMLLAAVSVLLTRIGNEKHRILCAVLSGACICLSCGIYQAYVSFALVLALGYFIFELLEDRFDKKAYRRWILTQIVVYIAAMAAYLVIWKVCMAVEGYSISTYEGISDLGNISPFTLLSAAYQAIKSFILFFVEWNFLKHGLTVYSGLNCLFLIFAAFVVVYAIFKSRIFKKGVHLLLLLACGVAIPFAVFIWTFASDGSTSYYTRMEQSICVCYILIAVLCERWIKPKLSNVMALLLSIIILNNGITANKFYYYMNRTYELTYATVLEMQTRIHLLDDGTIKYIAFIGSSDNGSFDEDFYVEASGLGSMGVLKSVNNNLAYSKSYIILFMAQYTDFQLTYYIINEDAEVPEITFGGTSPVPNGWTLEFPLADSETRDELEASDEVAEMGVWPASDSVQVIGDTIVIKLSEVETEEE